ncbi:MAG: hypothetical protein NTX75_01305 [Proteobacteria bacterium]|nr:hypothetical protein [Pseudomonadota bacterium]
MKKLIAMSIMLLFVTACATPRTTTQFVTTTTERDSVEPAAFVSGVLDIIFGIAALLTGNPFEIIGGTNRALAGGLNVMGSTQDTVIIPETTQQDTQDTVLIPEATQDAVLIPEGQNP